MSGRNATDDHRTRRHRHGVDAMYWHPGRSSSRPICRNGMLEPRRGWPWQPRSHRAQLQGNPLGLARDDFVIEQSESTRTALLFANMAARRCTIDVGGSFGRDSRAGRGRHGGVRAEWLSKLFGSDVASAIGKSSVTRGTRPRSCSARHHPQRPAGRDRASPDRAVRVHVLCGRGDPRNPVGHGRWRLGVRRARCGSGVAEDRRSEGRAGGASVGAEAAPSHGTRKNLRTGGQLKKSRPKALISWSSGKDSAFALHESGDRANSRWSAR